MMSCISIEVDVWGAFKSQESQHLAQSFLSQLILIHRHNGALQAKMKGYFNWVSNACLILFSILIPYNVHNQNKYTRGGEAVNRKQ